MPTLSCLALKKRLEFFAISFVTRLISTSITMHIAVSMGFSTIIIMNTPIMRIPLLMKEGRPLLIISRIASVSLV